MNTLKNIFRVITKSAPSVISGLAFGFGLKMLLLASGACQTEAGPIVCFSTDAAKSIASALASIVIAAFVIYGILLLVFHFLGSMSQALMRISGALLDRMLYVIFVPTLLWLLMFYQLDAVIVSSEYSGCAVLDVDTLKTGTMGPFLLRLLFYALAMLGMI